MHIQYSIIDSIYNTLYNDTSLKAFINPDRDIYKGFPSQDQSASLNLIVIESGKFDIIETNSEDKNEVSDRAYTLEVPIFVGFTISNKSDTLEKFDNFISTIINSIDNSTYIISNSNILNLSLVGFESSVYQDKIMMRECLITFSFEGAYVRGNL